MRFLTNKIALGGVQFGLNYGISNTGGITPIGEVRDIISTALRNKINYVDTAFAYGVSEKVLGETGVEKFNIVTKFINIDSGSELEKQFNLSLDNLKVKNVYGYLAHRYTDILNNSQVWNKLVELKKRGLIEKIGFSLNEPVELELLIGKGYIPDLIQVPYNYFDRRFEKSLIEIKREYETEVHTRSTFLQGLFFMDTNELNSHFDAVKKLLRAIQNENLSCQLFQFVLNRKFIDKVVIGVNDLQQFNENIDCTNKSLEPLPVLTEKISKEILSPVNWPK